MPLLLYVPTQTGPYRRLFSRLLTFVGQAEQVMEADESQDFDLRARWNSLSLASPAHTLLSEREEGPRLHAFRACFAGLRPPQVPVLFAASTRSEPAAHTIALTLDGQACWDNSQPGLSRAGRALLDACCPPAP